MTAPRTLGPMLSRHRRPRSIARTRLICFPHAGGLGTFYSTWASPMADDVDLLAATYSGHGDSIADIATACAEEIAALPRRPTTLFGHSLGALVAFETARAAARRGLSVPLIVSGARPPHSSRATIAGSDDDAALLAALRRLGGTPKEILDDPALAQAWLPAVIADLRLLTDYHYVDDRGLSVPITALIGRADPEAPLEEVRGWRRCTRGPFDLLTYPGGHFYLVDQRSQVLTELRRRLRPEHPSAGRNAGP